MISMGALAGRRSGGRARLCAKGQGICSWWCAGTDAFSSTYAGPSFVSDDLSRVKLTRSLPIDLSLKLDLA
jgi:hypothetical protein